MGLWWILEVLDRRVLLGLAPTGLVWLVALVRRGRPRLLPYVVWAFWAGLWGVWWIVAPQMLLAFGIGLLTGWASVGWVRRRVLAACRALAGWLLGVANRLSPDRPWERTP